MMRHMTGEGTGVAEGSPRHTAGLRLDCSLVWALTPHGITLGVFKGVRQGLPSLVLGFETGSVLAMTRHLSHGKCLALTHRTGLD